KGLIIGAVALIGFAARCDIGRQRHHAAFTDRLVKDCAVKRKGKRHLAALAFRLDSRIELAQQADSAFGAETYHVAWLETAARLGEGRQARTIKAAMQSRLDLSFDPASDAAARKSGRNDASVVDDQRIAWPQQIGKIPDGTIVPFRHGAGIDDKQS